MSDQLLKAEELVKSYGGRRVVDGVSYHVAPGEVVGLLGQRGRQDHELQHDGGAGGSRERPGDAGRPRSDPVAHAPAGTARAGVPPAGGLGLSQADGPGELHRHPGGAGGGPARAEPAGGRADRRVPAGEGRGLSGRAALGRRAAPGRGGSSLLSGPRFILFDEPFAGVDPIAVGELQRQIGGLGIAESASGHRSQRARRAPRDLRPRLPDRAGKDSGRGTPTQLASSERAKAVYLGSEFTLS